MKENDTAEVIELLKSYAVYENMISSNNCAISFFDADRGITGYSNEVCQEKMDYIKGLIDSFAPSNISTLLNMHYINRLSVAKCAECMAISRRTAFRLLKRAHLAINNRYQRMKGATNDNT